MLLSKTTKTRYVKTASLSLVVYEKSIKLKTKRNPAVNIKAIKTEFIHLFGTKNIPMIISIIPNDCIKRFGFS